MKNVLRLLILPFCLFLSACDLLLYPVAGFYVSYVLEIPKETEMGDFLQYSFTIQNPYPGWVNSGIAEKYEPLKENPDNRFVIQLMGDNGEVAWEKSSSIFWMPDLPYHLVGETTFRISINDEETLTDLKAGKRKLRMSIIRLADIKLGPWLSTKIGEETLTPVIIPAEFPITSTQGRRKK